MDRDRAVWWGDRPRYRPPVAHASAISPHRAVIEQAKGALMLRYGVGSYAALALLARWARESGSSLHSVSTALMHGICQGDRRSGPVDPTLVRWLEQQLRQEVGPNADELSRD